ncbi:hypothetical protein [Neglectibacter timonensis]|uniref:hypothetical protein n=1 Tax=Neglectibacter timonensis TaxID=1776382 RepID=UPI002064F2B3|nr:hypothetical protein [Neglectibacter timonensis]DAU48212.1 MAG TPA: hypothetical protein [Bacteriophage sp.]
MDNGMSLSDIAAVTRSNENEGWGSGWFLIVVLFLFMFGFGRNGWNNNDSFGQYATAASQQEILFGQQFGQLNDRLTNIGSGICNLGYEMQGNIGQLGKEMALAQNGTNMTIMQTGNNIQSQMADCCCKTQRAIDSVNANIDAKFAALEKSQLEGRIAQLEQANSQLFVREQLYGVVRYPNGYSYNAGPSPFCGCNC